MKYPEAPRVFVFDRPFLEKAGLSFKRIFFLYECAAEAAHELRVGETVEQLGAALAASRAERLAVTESPSTRWKELVGELKQSVEVEVVRSKNLVEVPQDFEAKRFTPFWKKFGQEWGG